MPREELSDPVNLRGPLLMGRDKVLIARCGIRVLVLHRRRLRHQTLYGDEEVGYLPVSCQHEAHYYHSPSHPLLWRRRKLTFLQHIHVSPFFPLDWVAACYSSLLQCSRGSSRQYRKGRNCKCRKAHFINEITIVWIRKNDLGAKECQSERLDGIGWGRIRKPRTLTLPPSYILSRQVRRTRISCEAVKITEICPCVPDASC